MKGRYKKYGKIVIPISKEDFIKGMNEGLFHKPEHKGLAVLLYYTGIRIGEALRSTREQFTIDDETVMFEVGTRLKHGIKTPALKLPKSLPFMNELIWCIESTRPKERIWPFSYRTGYNVVTRAFPFYPHFFRLNRITQFLQDNWGIPELRTWTGLTTQSLDAYVGIVDIDRMSKALS